MIENLPFDRIYLYPAEEAPFHLSWAPIPVGQVVKMVETKGGRVPKVVVRGTAES